MLVVYLQRILTANILKRMNYLNKIICKDLGKLPIPAILFDLAVKKMRAVLPFFLHRFWERAFYPVYCAIKTKKSGDVTQLNTIKFLLCQTADNRRLQVVAGMPPLLCLYVKNGGTGSLE